MRPASLPITLGAALLAVFAWPAAAQKEPASAAVQTNLTVHALSSALTNALSLDADNPTRTALTNAYTDALRWARRRDSLEIDLQGHREAVSAASNQTDLVRGRIEEVAAMTNDLSGLKLPELKSRVSDAEAKAKTAEEERDELEEEAKRRSARRKEIPKLIADANSSLEKIKLELHGKPGEETTEAAAKARQRRLLAQESLKEKEVATMHAELKAYDATEALLGLRTQLEDLRAKARAREVAALRSVITGLAEQEAKKTAAEAELEKKRLQREEWKPFVELSEIATNNAVLAETLTEVKDSIRRETTRLNSAKKRLTELKDDFKTLEEQVRAFEQAEVRINQRVGELLRDYHRNLAIGVRHDVIRQRLARNTDTSLQELEHRKGAREHLDIAGKVAALLRAFEQRELLDPEADGEKTQKVRARATKLLEATRERHLELQAANRELGAVLRQLNATEIGFRKQSEKFRSYVKERVLWVRSSTFLSTSEILAELRALGQLLHPANWIGLAPILWDGLVSEPFVGSFWIMLASLILLAQPGARRSMKRAAERSSRRENVAMTPTLVASLATVVMAAPVPVLFATISVLLGSSGSGTPFSDALANGLMFSTSIYFTLGWLRQTVRRHGLSTEHLHWSETDTGLLRRHLNWFLGLAAGLTFVITFVEGDRSELSQGRLSFLLLAGATLVFGWILLHPTRGLSSTLFGNGSKAWRHLRFGLALLTLLTLAAASLIGYHFTALVLSWRLVDTVWLVLGVVFARALMLRWFYLERKRIALAKLKERDEDESDDTVTMKKKADDVLANIQTAEIKEQTRSLVGLMVVTSFVVGLWTIWADVTPALNMLDRRALWHVEVAVESEAPIPGGNLMGALSDAASRGAGTDPEENAKDGEPKTITRAVTIADVLFAVFVILVMLMAARNLPSLLEILILKHLRLETGGAYAVTNVVQYAVVGAGILVACASIGLSWEKVKWLAAAVTLGIGFGLQEIFANFVAGIILLFERPVRIGDYITVDGAAGVVSRIRMRATTIRNWDRQETVIPNKDLITGRLTNWTLSDPYNRVVFSVGVAYGSDVDKVEQVIEEALADNRYVLDEPKPRITFDAFGDSALNFTIRAYIEHMEERLQTIHTLHRAIDRKFREADIEIAFPQRDLHIRSGAEKLPAPAPRDKDESKENPRSESDRENSNR